jgi:hypothetical protein
MMIRVVRAHNDKGKETHRKALNRKVREGSAKIAKKRSWGQDFSFSSLLEQAVSLERMPKLYARMIALDVQKYRGISSYEPRSERQKPEAVTLFPAR